MPSDPTEIDELSNLLSHGGWQRFVAYVEAEWGIDGAAYRELIRKALASDGTPASDTVALGRLRIAESQRDALMRAIKWPQERLNAAKAAVQVDHGPAHPGRRGGL